LMSNFSPKSGGQFGLENGGQFAPKLVVNLNWNRVVNLTGFSKKQLEDVPHDMIPYKDADGNVYDFGFGLNWKGIIKDARTANYSVKK
ncbi:MAG: hypothetical protein PHF81_10670, partial [Flavobacterium sp.]|nr:hypothetical protein [Flavobacterium sp.]